MPRDPLPEQSFRVRRATPSDKNALTALLDRYFRDEGIWETDSPEVILGYLQRADLGFFVAEAEGQLVGCVLCRHLPDVSGASECKRLYVLPSFRGRGIAVALMAAVESATLTASLDAVYLDSKDEFKAAIALYLRLGYEVCERFNDNPQATVFLRKQLV